jgi:hypothetical protein
MREVILLLLAVASFLPCVPAESASDPELTIEILQLNFVYPTEGCEFSKRHFSNMRVYHFGSDSATLRNGHFASKGSTGRGSSEVGFESFHALPSQPGEPFALAIYSWQWFMGSSSQSRAAQVFTCNDGKLKVIQQISNDSHHSEANASYDPATRMLTIKSNRYGNGARCCPEQLDVMKLRWDGSEFKRVSLKTIPHPK